MSDTYTKSYADIVKINLDMPKFMSETIKASAKSMANELDSNKVVIISRLPETNTIIDDNRLVMQFVDGLVGSVTIWENEIRDVVRLGSPREDQKRLIKVTFTNERSARLFMEYHRQYAKGLLIPESVNSCFPNDEERYYTNFGIRPDLPKEKRDIIKESAKKVYGWNKEIRTQAEAKGLMPEVSYSWRYNGNIFKFVKNQHNEWSRDNEWQYTD